MKTLLLVLLFPLLFLGQNSDIQNNSQDNIFTMFYNVENLFDTINNSNTNDESFLPTSKKKWNTTRYRQKISQLERVFKEINNGESLNLIGLCEVENKLVIEDLLKSPFFINHNYTIVHQDSPDQRGIDCALLFDNRFSLVKYDFIEINNPIANRPTRDIVYVCLKFNNELIHVFVNHWPSRWGGQKETNHKRVFAAQTLRDYINNNIPKDEYMIIMGDFNDYASNASLGDVLVKDDLVNLMTTDLVTDLGSYNYKGSWNFIDHMIVSKNSSKSNFKVLSAGAFSQAFMLYEKQKGDKYPSRTYGGSVWYGGFSDHLPIYCQLSFTF